MNQSLVLDASVAVKWFFLDEPLREKALEVRSQLIAQPDRFLVPSLFHTELMHVLARKSKNDAHFVSQSVNLILRLGIRTCMLSEKGIKSAVKLTCHGLSGYDATYAALAHEHDAKWITADLKAIKKAGKTLAVSLELF